MAENIAQGPQGGKSTHIPRHIDAVFERFSKAFRVLEVTGPRQAGKTTAIRRFFGHLPYVSFENPEVLKAYRADRARFLQSFKDGAVFDEIQHAPDVSSYLNTRVDEDQRPGRFVITGSQNFAISGTVSQSLAGRAGVIRLLPLSLAELHEPQDIDAAILMGGYPAVCNGVIPREDFYASYVDTYLERDAKQLANLHHLTQFKIFLILCANRVGQVVSYSTLARDVGVSEKLIRHWLSVLQASYILFTLPPYFNNSSKRATHNPKLYFYDTGLACFLLHLRHTAQVRASSLKGALFENMMVLEVLKNMQNCRLLTELYFWQDEGKREVDLVCNLGGRLCSFEFKATTSMHKDDCKHLAFFQNLQFPPLPTGPSYVVYAGEEATRPWEDKDITFVPYPQLWSCIQKADALQPDEA